MDTTQQEEVDIYNLVEFPGSYAEWKSQLQKAMNYLITFI